MSFNERVHAFIAAKFYVHLVEDFGSRGEAAFIHATQYYAQQRGRRMAQRAIRDGRELDYGTYMEYGEWTPTQEIIDEGIVNQSELYSISPDYHRHITMCPWYAQFRDMGLTDAGNVYCQYLDSAICQGFNPKLVYLVPHNLNRDGYCTHIVKDANLSPNESHPKKMEYVKDFTYHCAHSYWSYREALIGIFGEEGKKTSQKVLKDFTETYGQDMTDQLLSFKDTNFNIAD